jgi:hypothetical protein
MPVNNLLTGAFAALSTEYLPSRTGNCTRGYGRFSFVLPQYLGIQTPYKSTAPG